MNISIIHKILINVPFKYPFNSLWNAVQCISRGKSIRDILGIKYTGYPGDKVLEYPGDKVLGYTEDIPFFNIVYPQDVLGISHSRNRIFQRYRLISHRITSGYP